MALTLAWESESMINTFLRNTAESVSAIASTSVDLPTPPFVFMTATVLRMPPTYPSAHIPTQYGPKSRDEPTCGLS